MMAVTTFHWLAVVVALLSITITVDSAPQVTAIDAFEIIEAEFYDYNANAVIFHDCQDTSIFYIGNITTGVVLSYYSVNFSTGAQVIDARVAPYANSGIIHFHLDHPNDPEFASFPTQQVDPGNKCNFMTLVNFVNVVPTGVHDVHITFDGPPQDGFVNLDWFRFGTV